MRTLVSYLNEKTPQELRLIAELWEASLSDRLYTGNTFQLAQEMQSEFMQRRVLEKLEAGQLQTLAFFSNYSGPALSVEEAAVELNRAKATLEIMRLRQVGLLYDDRVKVDNLPTPTGQANEPRKRSGFSEIYGRPSATPTANKKAVIVLPRELARPLQRLVSEKLGNANAAGHIRLSHLPLVNLLERLGPDSLESLAEPWGILSLQGNANHSEMVKEVAAALHDSALQRKVLNDLPNDSQEIFAQLKRQGGRTTIEKLLQEFVSLRRLARNLRPLTDHLLIWEAFEDGESVVFIPPEIASPQVNASGRSSLSLQTTTEPSNPTAFPPYALAWDSLTFMNYLGQNEVELTTQHYIPKRHVKKLSTLFWVQEDLEEPLRFAFMTQLCQKLQLYDNETYTRRLQPGPGLDEWLRLDFYEQTRRFFQTWLNSTYFSGPVGFPYYYGSSAAMTQANKAILSWLTECQSGTWYSVGSLLHKVQREEPFFIRPRRELMNQFGLQRVEEFARLWPRVEGEIIRNTLGTVLEWLGLVKVGRDSTGRVESFAVTELGLELTGVSGATHQSLVSVEKPLLVQPNFEIMLFAPQVDTLWTLLKFANPKKLDQVSLFTIDRNAVLRGMESGLTATVLLEWLSRRSMQPLAQNVVTSVQDWSKGFRRVMIERTTLLEVEDPEVLDELLKTKQYADYFVRRLSPTAALIKLPEPKTTYSSFEQRDEPLKSFKTKLKNGGFFAT